MTKLKYLVLALVGAVVAMAGAANAGVTAFTVTPTTVSGSGEVAVATFTSTGGYTKLAIDWGDGSQTMLATPLQDASVTGTAYKHIYSKVGTYTPMAYAYTNTSSDVLFSGASTTPVTVSAIDPATTPNKALQVYDPSQSSQAVSTATTSMTIRLRWTGATVPSAFTSYSGTVSLTLSGVTAQYTATALTFSSNGTVSFNINNIVATNGGTITLTSISINGTSYSDSGWTYARADGAAADSRFIISFATPASVSYTNVETAGSTINTALALTAAGTAIPATINGTTGYIFKLTSGAAATASNSLSGGSGVSVNFGTLTGQSAAGSSATTYANLCATVTFSGTTLQMNFYGSNDGGTTWTRLHYLTNPMTVTINVPGNNYGAYHYNDSGVADGSYVSGNTSANWTASTYGTYGSSATQGGYVYTLWVKQLSGAGVAAGSDSGSSGCEISSSSINVLGVLFPLMLVIAGLVVLSRRNRA